MIQAFFSLRRGKREVNCCRSTTASLFPGKVMTSIRKRGKFADDVDDVGNVYDIAERRGGAKDRFVLDAAVWRHIMPEAILGYIWWSIFFSLAPTIWFFRLNLLEISGYEAFAVLLLSPIFTLIPFIDRIISSKYGMISTQALTVCGILCYHAPSAFSRLLITSFANFFAMLWLSAAWWHKSKAYREFVFGGMVIGFFLKLVLRIFCITLNPIWTSSITNIIIFTVGIICAIDRATFILEISDKESDEEARVTNTPTLSWVTVALGMGSWFFLAQWLFGEVSVISRYTGTGAPSWSVMPVPGGAAVLAAMIIGISISDEPFISSSFWWIFGCFSALMLFHAPSLLAFIGGLGLALYTTSVFPTLANLTSKCSKGKVLTVSLLVAVILLLASVWTVAYNFVPGGTVTRERNDSVLIIVMVLIGFAAAAKVEPKDAIAQEKEKISSPPEGVASFIDNGEKGKKVFKNGIVPALYMLLIMGTFCMVGRYYQREANRNEAQLAVKDPKMFTSMIWTVHFGYDNQGWHSFKRSVQLMKDTGADVIGVLESDCSRPYVGSTDFVSYVEEELGFYADYGPKTKDHTWGAAIISRYPIIKSEHHLLPSPEGELAPAVSASVNISGRIVDFLVVHMGNDRDDLDRKLQAEELAKIMDASKNPVVFLGYVTSAPGSRDHLHLMDSGRTKDIDYEDLDRWCEYILYRDLIRLGYARISHGGLSDTEVQLGKFRIPDDINNHDDNNAITTTQGDVDEKIWFSDKFGDFHIGDFYGEGHHFHMSTPKYFFPVSSH